MSYLSATVPWLLYLLLLVVFIVGLFLNILGLPGLWLIVLSAIAYAWWFEFAYIGWWTIGIIVVLGGLAELIEFVAGAAGSKQAGGSKRGMVAAIAGGLIGGIAGSFLIPVPILGTIIGSVLGCAIAVYPVEYAIGKSHADSLSISYGAAKGRVFGIIAKTGVGIVMTMVAAVMAIPVQWRSPTPTSPVAPSTQPTTVPAISAT